MQAFYCPCAHIGSKIGDSSVTGGSHTRRSPFSGIMGRMSYRLAAYSDRGKGVVALVALSLLFASMGLFVRFLNADFTILQQTYLRIIMAFLLGTAIFWKGISFRKLRALGAKDWAILLLRAGSMYLLGVALLSKAYTLTYYSNVSFLGALPLTAVLGFVLLREKVTIQKIVYVLLGFAGVVLVAVKDYSHLLTWGHGEILALIASLFFSVSYIARKFQSDALNNKEIAVMMFAIAALLTLATSAFVFREGLPRIVHGSDVLVLAAAGLFNVINLFLTNYGFQKVDAVLASNILMLESAFAVVLGLIFFAEMPTLRDLLGGAIIVLSAILMNRADRPIRRHAKGTPSPATTSLT